MVLLNPKDKSGTYKNIKLESTRKGDINKAVENTTIIILNPKKRTFFIISKINNISNIPKNIQAKKVLPTSLRAVPRLQTTNITLPNIPQPLPQLPIPPSTFPRLNDTENTIEETQTKNINPPANPILLPNERLLPSKDITPRYIGINIRDIIFQISRLRYLIRHFDGIITDPSERIIFSNFKYNYAQISNSQNISSIKYYLQKILVELNALLQFRNPFESLENEIQLLNSNDPLESKIESLISQVLNKFYSSINVEDANSSDFTKQDFYQLYTNFDLKQYPIIDQFLRNQANKFGPDLINDINILSAQPHAQTDLNSQFQLITWFIFKYGLNFPTPLYQFFMTLIRNNLNLYKNIIIKYLAQNPWDQASYNAAQLNLGLEIENTNNLQSRYETDILNYKYPTTLGSSIRTAQDVIAPIRQVGEKFLTNAWRNPIQTAVKLTTAASAGKTLFDYATGDNSTLTDFGMYNLKSNVEDYIGEQATANIPSDYKNIFKPVAKYGAHKAFETGQNIVNTAIPVAQGISNSIRTTGNQIAEATNTITNFGNTIREYLPFQSTQNETVISEIQIPLNEEVLPPIGPPPTIPNSETIREQNAENYKSLLESISNFDRELGFPL